MSDVRVDISLQSSARCSVAVQVDAGGGSTHVAVGVRSGGTAPARLPINARTPKRLAAAPPPSDTKLQRVMHALSAVAHDSARFASGSSEQFPIPGISFRGDGDELLPLRNDDAQKIKNVWQVDGDALESHNAHWLTFLEDRVTSMRQLLSIPPTVVVNLSLKKLMLVDAGGSLCVRRSDEERGVGVIGTLLLVLPGAFEGGDYVVHQPAKKEDDEVAAPTTTWRPRVCANHYEMAYAVFYDHCTYVAEPVTQGTASCLVYDLVLPTPSDMQLFTGAQRLVDTALNDFFDEIPEPLVKRCRIGDDAWRMVNAFAVERRFVYRIASATFEDLDDDARKIAESLATFCAHSGRQYVLYLASVLYSRKPPPWIKHGESKRLRCQPISLRQCDEIAPFPYLDDCHWRHIDEAPAKIKRIAKELHGDYTTIDVYWTNALVVLPASVEAKQMATLPTHDAMYRLHGLLGHSFDDALAYARRIVHYNATWHVRSRDMDPFAWFVRLVVESNDRQLFTDLLLTVDLERFDDQGALSAAVKHFGWPACADAVIKRLLSTWTTRARINWVVSIFYEGMNAAQIDQMLDVLISLYPWTDATVDPHEAFDKKRCDEQIDSFKCLLAIANRASPQRLVHVASVRREMALLHVVVPAVVGFLEERDAAPPLQSLLYYAWKVYQPVLLEVRNEFHKKIRLSSHCATCDQLQYFLLSSAIETTIAFTSSEHREHIEVVISSAVASQREADVVIGAGETTLRLTKERRATRNPRGVFPFAQRWNERMAALRSRYSDQASEISQLAFMDV